MKAKTKKKQVKMSVEDFKCFPDKWEWDSIVEHIVVHYRWIFVMFLLPVSCFYDLWFYTRNKIVFALSSAPSKHNDKVAYVQKQVEEYNRVGEGKGMCTARPGWQTISPQNMSYKSRMYPIEINLVDILEIDPEARTVRCEPLVTMGQLTHTLDRLGWMIPILPELDDLTVGGLVMGTGVETSSHKFGLFQHICTKYELVLGDGSLVECSETSDPDLFYSVPWSYGTLGFLMSVTIKMVPSKRFVKLDYIPCHSMKEMLTTFERETERSDAKDYVECLVYSKDKSVVMTGQLVDSCQPGKLNEIGRWYKPWFFKHVEAFLSTLPSNKAASSKAAAAAVKAAAVDGTKEELTELRDEVEVVEGGSSDDAKTEYIPLRDYFHRHSRSIFWEIQDIIPFGNNPVFRYLLGWLIPPKVSLLKLTQGKTLKRLYETNHMIQDMLVPIEDLEKSLEVFDDSVAIYPIWLCPFKLPPNPGMLNTKSDKEKMFVDVGVYGVPKRPGFDVVQVTRRIEEFVRSVNGFQMMYADSYMDREEFRQMFDHTLYDSMRARLGCEGRFPEVFAKVNKKARSG